MTTPSERVQQWLYDIPQAAEALNVSPRTIATLIASGQLSSVTIGRRRLVPRQSIDAFVAARIAAACDTSGDAA